MDSGIRSDQKVPALTMNNMYMKMLRHLRDFLTEEELKFLPGRLHAHQVLFLEQNKEVETNIGDTKAKIFTRVIQVFTADGTWIGEVPHPDFIPSKEN